MNTFGKFLFIPALSIIFGACCKCAEDIKYSDTVLLENFSANDIENPMLIYSKNGTSLDTITLTPDTVNYSANILQLSAPQPLDYQKDWNITINDSTSYKVSNFKLKKGTASCCNGITFLSSYEVNGVSFSGDRVIIAK